ncbi:hypothetical protein CAPTEDRAFT_194077 [Capitella teleta]|uniref:Uncharacterized protein n=1 Tax=Capitella teleta TaxID=283909 RepID=R7UGU7_CAPTE|nr:hypothetical protein CAPTEDRAFT_194077 [Capitella teleta]|eukprot:ELU05440.1 hypothetical protein CAPTEDRAFT_194077 [Capitella teleta]
MQSRRAKQTLIDLEKMLRKQDETICLFKNAIQDMMTSQRKQASIIQSQTTALKSAEMNAKFLQKRNKEKDLLNRELTECISTFRDRFDEVANALKLSEEERCQLAAIGSGHLIASGKRWHEEASFVDQQRAASQEAESGLSGAGFSWRSHLGQQQKIIRLMLGLLSTRNTAAVPKKTKRTRVMFDQVLSDECVRPLPIFVPFAANDDELQMSNTWIPVPEFHDQPVRDAALTMTRIAKGLEEQPQQQQHQQEHQPQPQELARYDTGGGGGVVEMTPELFILDLNPVSKNMRKATSQIFDDIGHRPVRMFHRRYLFSQMKSKADAKKVVKDDLDSAWERFLRTFFQFTIPLFSKNRDTTWQKSWPEITAVSVTSLVGKFAYLCTGTDKYLYETGELLARLSQNATGAVKVTHEDVIKAMNLSQYIILLAVCYTAAQVCLTFYRTTLPKDALVKEARVVSRPPGKTAVIHEYVHQDYGKIYDNGDDDDEDTDDETSFLNPSLN